jgi:hypothetical protein
VKPVVQLERTGCGIASVAALAGVSYRQAQRTANRLGIFAEDSRLWSETQPVRRLLKQYRLRGSGKEIPFVSWSALPDLALLAVKWHCEGSRPFWHWVVFVREQDGAYVLDSQRALKAHARTDFGRMRPKWSIKVEGCPSRKRNRDKNPGCDRPYRIV